MLVIVPYGTDIEVQPVGNTHLHEHTPQDAAETAHEVVGDEQSALFQLFPSTLPRLMN